MRYIVVAIDSLDKRVKYHSIRTCKECNSSYLNYFNRVYIDGELFPFPYCKDCGLVQWQVIPGLHLTLEKLYELYLQIAGELGLSEDDILSGIEYIKKRKGDEGYSDDVCILKEVFELL